MRSGETTFDDLDDVVHAWDATFARSGRRSETGADNKYDLPLSFTNSIGKAIKQRRLTIVVGFVGQSREICSGHESPRLANLKINSPVDHQPGYRVNANYKRCCWQAALKSH